MDTNETRLAKVRTMIWAWLSPLCVLAVLLAVFPVMYQSAREDRRLRERGVDHGYLDAEAGHPIPRPTWGLRRNGRRRPAA